MFMVLLWDRVGRWMAEGWSYSSVENVLAVFDRPAASVCVSVHAATAIQPDNITGRFFWVTKKLLTSWRPWIE
jgi:hypothetical protein